MRFSDLSAAIGRGPLALCLLASNAQSGVQPSVQVVPIIFFLFCIAVGSKSNTINSFFLPDDVGPNSPHILDVFLSQTKDWAFTIHLIHCIGAWVRMHKSIVFATQSV